MYGTSNTPYRSARQLCELCNELAPPDEVHQMAGLSACPRCREGDLEPALRRWRLRARHQRMERGGGDTWPQYSLVVEISRPSQVDVVARFTPKTIRDYVKALVMQDREIGFKTFDDSIQISFEDYCQSTTMELLEIDGIRTAIESVVGRGCKVELGTSTIWATMTTKLESRLPASDQIVRSMVALAVHLEKFARSEKELSPADFDGDR